MSLELPERTADLTDLLGPKAHVLAFPWKSYGGLTMFRGPAVTVRVADDTSRVRPILEEQGAGRLLVIDNGGSSARAVFGDNFGILLRDNGWAGALVNGYVRDTAQLAKLPVGLVALGVTPLRPVKQQYGEQDVAVVIAGVHIRNGDWITVDVDGVVCVPSDTQN